MSATLNTAFVDQRKDFSIEKPVWLCDMCTLLVACYFRRSNVNRANIPVSFIAGCWLFGRIRHFRSFSIETNGEETNSG